MNFNTDYYTVNTNSTHQPEFEARDEIALVGLVQDALVRHKTCQDREDLRVEHRHIEARRDVVVFL